MARCTERTTDYLDVLLSDDVFDTRQLLDLIESLTATANSDDSEVALAASDELRRALVLQSEIEPYAEDYRYGESVIADSHFEAYAKELAEDIGAVSADATWPHNCIDWKAAAEALLQDYTAVDFEGARWWVR